jgi:hypothetical protein
MSSPPRQGVGNSTSMTVAESGGTHAKLGCVLICSWRLRAMKSPARRPEVPHRLTAAPERPGLGGIIGDP